MLGEIRGLNIRSENVNAIEWGRLPEEIKTASATPILLRLIVPFSASMEY